MSFPVSAIIYPLPRAPKGPLNSRRFFCFGSLLKGLGLSTCTFLCIVSLRVWGILSYVLGGGDFSYGLVVFDFSHDEVKQAG